MGAGSSMDQSFLKKLNETIERNYSNEQFGVDELAHEIGISRSQLHRKLQAFNGPSASQMIREVRLTRAMEMLQNRTGNASEVSYRVGFSSPSYFNTCFHEHFGYPPGKVKQQIVRKSFQIRSLRQRNILKIGLGLFTILVIYFSAEALIDIINPNQQSVSILKISLVVLPFEYLSQDQSNQYFADGMTETLITYLAKVKSLKVISRTTAMSLKNSNMTSPEIAKKLGVDVIVEGSVLREGNRVRITAQLIKGDKDEHLWSNHYDHELRDILKIHSDVAKEIATQIQISLSPEEEKLLGDAPTVDPLAYEAYLLGRYHLYRLSPDHYLKAFDYFHKALEIDPDYSPAHAGLALVWNHRGLWSGYRPLEVAALAKQYAHKALSMDQNNAEAHQALAGIYSLYEWHWEKATMEYEIVVQLAPNLTEARLLYGDMLLSLGEPERAFDHITTALELDPMNPFSYSMLGWALYADHRFEEAIEELSVSIEMDPSMSLSLRCLWSSHHKLGNHKESLNFAKLFFKAQGYPQVEKDLEEGFRQGGYHHALIYAAIKLEEFSKHTYVPAMRIARLYAQGGNEEKAVQLLQKSYQERFPSMMSINVDPDWDPLLDNEAFQMLLRKMNFPDPKIP